MGYSDPKFYARPQTVLADSNVFTSTYTASNTATGTGVAPSLPVFTRRTAINGLKLQVVTAPKIGSTVFTFLNGTNTFATATVTSTVTAGQIVVATLTNTASTATTTQTTTLANGSTVVGTITTTTNWSIFGTLAGPTATVVGSATASGDTWGKYELFVEAQEAYL